MKKSFSIIIPAYNEESSIKEVLTNLKKHLKTTDYQFEIIIVNDGSTDQTLKILKEIKKINLINHPYNKGYGAALKTGVKAAKYDWILIIDADGTYPTKIIPDLLKISQKEKPDLLIGARDKNDKAIPFNRRHAKKFLNKFASYLTSKNVIDLNSGLRVFKKEIVLKYWNLFPQRFSFTSTLTMICLSHDYDVKFVPIEYYKRKGKSTLKAKNFWEFLKLVIKLSLFFKPIKVFIPLSLIIFLGAIYVLFSFLIGWTDKFFDTTFIVLCATALQTLFFGLLAEIVIHNR